MLRCIKGNARGARWCAVIGLAAIWVLWSPQARATSNRIPYIDSISPAATATGSAPTLTIRGTNFTDSSVIQVTLDGATTPTPLVTTVLNATQLTATLPALKTAKDGTAFVTVTNGAGLVSNVVELPITNNSSPVLTFRETAQAHSGGNHPYTPPVVADFNNDGIPDLAVSNDAPQNYGISVFLGTGGGSFLGSGTPWPTGNLPKGLAVGDFNGDGNMDLAVANSLDASITILLGNGDGSFEPGITTSLATGAQPYLLAAADFNGDGLLDLAVACLGTGGGSGFVTVLLGTSTPGSFAAPVNYGTGTIGQPAGLALADFDANGTLDLAVSDASNSEVWILSGNVDGSFSPPTPYPTKAVTGGPAGIVAADFNGDGQPDLAIAYPNDGTPEISVMLNVAGTFPAHTEYPTVADGTFLAAADLNGDGILDLAVPALTSNGVSVLLGNGSSGIGNGAFGSPTSFTVDSTFTSVLGVAAADFNADGRIDMAFTATGSALSVVSVLLQTPQITIPTNLNFAPQLKGTQSPAQTVTLTYTGGPPLTFYSLNSTTNFSESNNNCPLYPAVMGAPASCTVNVYFKPSTSGSLSGSLSIADNVTGISNPQIVSLSGTGQAPLAGVSTASLTFGNQLVGTTSASQSVSLSNTGNGPLTITSVAVSSGFKQTNTCGGSVAANSTCSITVSFAPTTSGAANGSLTVTDNSGETSGTVQTVGLTGSGIAPAGLAPASLTFTSQMLGTSSASQTLTLSNSNTTPLSITSVTITGANSGDFSETNTCGTSLAAGANCTISVGFKPAANGTRTGTLMVTANATGAAGTTQSAVLSGTGVSPVVGLTPSGLTFSSFPLRTTSTVQALSLSNTGTAALTITSIAITGTNGGDFTQTNTCGSSLAAGANCTISVSFTPSANGARTGTLIITDNSNAVSGSTQTASLTGTGASPQAGIAPGSLTFGGQLTGTTSAGQAITLSNTGTTTLTISGIAASAGFAQTNTCGTSVAAGASCAITVTFSPTAVGSSSGTLTVTDNNNSVGGSAQTVSLSGTGTAPGVKLSASSLSFGDENLGSASAAQTVTVTNTGTATLTLSGITVGGDFSETNTCAGSLNAGTSCAVTVTFTPTAILSRTGTLTVTDNASSGTQTVSLSGTGLGAEPSLSQSKLTFAGELVGVTSAAQTATLKNLGNGAMTIAHLAVSGDFAETTTCGASLAANASCTISVTFKPTAGGTRSGALTFSAGGSQTISLSGEGQDFSFSGGSTDSVSPGQSATFNLSATPNGGLSDSIALTCSGAPSEATCTVSPTSVSLNGSSASSFAVTVSTTAASGLAPLPRALPPSEGDRGKWLFLGLVAIAGALWLADRRQQGLVGRRRLGLATAGMLVLLALGIVACGGGGTSTSPSNPGTPAGTYNLTVTGTVTSGSVAVSHDVQVTLKVQ